MRFTADLTTIGYNTGFGNDKIQSGSGNDTINGGSGNNRIDARFN
ncbi:hypothetical protein [Nostoc sp.]